jgi:prepilin-type N-terminal cleavage/methylation domain-containing protein
MKLKTTMNNEHGLTLIEMITTMAILTIVVSTAVPNFTVWRNNYQIRAESERVHMDLLSARMTAMKSGNNIVVTFLPGSNSYSILNDINNNGTADTGEPLSTRTLENNVQFGFSGPSITDMDGNTGITETVAMGPSDIVTFNPRGQADLSGVLFLIHNNHIPEGNGRLRGISVIQATGAAELWYYNSALTIPWE